MKKDLDEELINKWKEGIDKREQLKKSLQDRERSDFIESKKKELQASKDKMVELGNLVDLNALKEENPVNTESVPNETINPESTAKDNVKVSGSYQELVKKINENADFQQLKDELKKYRETPLDKTVAEHLSDRIKYNAQELKNAFPIVLRIINELTGYTKVENLKKEIEQKEQAKIELKQKLAIAKKNYNKSIDLRSMSQKQINELLQRQNTWSLEDLERFTHLYKNDHSLEKEESENFKILQDLELQRDENDEKLSQSILTRYHEEQIWSDKIRKFSTWGTLLIMGVNLFLFVLVQLVFEPFKRRKLVNAFELKVKELLEENQNQTQLVVSTLPLAVETQSLTSEPKEPVKDLETDNFSIPAFNRHDIRGFIQQLCRNLMKLTGSGLLVIDKLQLDQLFVVGFIFSFCIGLLF